MECPNEDCDAVYCVNCLPRLTHSFEEGLGPLRRGVLELRCQACNAVLQRTEFRSEIEMAARDLVQEGSRRIRTALTRHGVRQLLRRRASQEPES